MDVYTQPGKKHPMGAECVCVYASSIAKADNLSCHIVARKYVFTRFKTQ